MKRFLRAIAWGLWLVWPFRRPPVVVPLENVSELITYDEWCRRHPELIGHVELVQPGAIRSVPPCLRGEPSATPPRVPLAAARQWALEMTRDRRWSPQRPLTIGGVVVQTARVKVIEATVDEVGAELARELRVLWIEYPDGRDERLEFFADGRLYFHIKG